MINKTYPVLTLLAAIALAGQSITAVADAPAKLLGDVLVDAKDMTLYTFDKDSAGKSACNGQCAINWPPLMAPSDAKAAGDYSVVTRDDGTKQWAYKGRPLNTWLKDKTAGDRTGDGVNNVWHVAR